MQTLSPYLFIHIGLSIRALMHCKDLAYDFVIIEAESLIKNLTESGFQVSSIGLHKLKDFIKAIKPLPKTTILTLQQSKDLGLLMEKVEQMVYAEASTKNIYVVNKKRYDLDILLKRPEEMFAKDIFSMFPTIAQYDLREGFICLAFSRPTAAAFHILRATESILKEVYFLIIKRKREKVPMWGNMIAALKRRKNVDQELISRLDYIREKHRNPTDHPELIYNIEDAENLLGLCREAISGMSKVLQKNE